MKHLQVTFSNGETELWYIPEWETVEVSISEIQKETGLKIVDHVKVRGY